MLGFFYFSSHLSFFVCAVEYRAAPQISVAACLFKEHLLERIFARLSILPAHRVHLTVKLFTYSAYQDCTKGFHLVTRKDVALAGGEFHRTGSSLRVEKVVLDETRVAALHLDKGAFVNFFQFGGISEKREGCRTSSC